MFEVVIQPVILIEVYDNNRYSVHSKIKLSQMVFLKIPVRLKNSTKYSQNMLRPISLSEKWFLSLVLPNKIIASYHPTSTTLAFTEQKIVKNDDFYISHSETYLDELRYCYSMELKNDVSVTILLYSPILT